MERNIDSLGQKISEEKCKHTQFPALLTPNGRQVDRKKKHCNQKGVPFFEVYNSDKARYQNIKLSLTANNAVNTLI